MRVNVHVDDEAAHLRLLDLRSRAGSIRPALELIADDFLTEERDLFAGRAHWRPLDPAWAARKSRLGFGDRTLVMSDNLERSLTGSSGKYAVREVGDNELTVGTSDPVAHLHQSGTKKMPRRPPVRTTHETRRRWSGILHDWLLGDIT